MGIISTGFQVLCVNAVHISSTRESYEGIHYAKNCMLLTNPYELEKFLQMIHMQKIMEPTFRRGIALPNNDLKG